MKRILFIVSHIGSGTDKLVEILNSNPRVEIYETGFTYQHPIELNALIEMPHKNHTVAAIYGDHFLFNSNILSKSFYDICKFLYVIREAKSSINLNTYHPLKQIVPYYRFRIRRIYEMIRKTKDYLFLTWDEIQKENGLKQIENFLDLKDPLIPIENMTDSYEDKFPMSLVELAQDTYEKYLFKIRDQNNASCHHELKT